MMEPDLRHQSADVVPTLWAAGLNNYGQLGYGNPGNNTIYKVPIQIAQDVMQVAAGDSHSLFIKEDGALFGMGSNYQKMLGGLIEKHFLWLRRKAEGHGNEVETGRHARISGR